MDLNRKEVPVSGQVGVCVGVQAGASVPEGLEYYVVLEGSTLSHVTSAQGCADGLSFKFTAPGHNMAECVLIRLCQYECGRPFLLPWFGELFLEYMQDEAQEISEVPLSHPGNLNSTRYLELSEKSPGRGTSSAERGHKLGAFTQDSTDHLWGWNQRPAEWDDVSDVSSGVVIIRETEEKNLPLNEQEKRACQASYNTDYPHKWGNLGSQGEQGHNVKQERFSVELTQTGTGRTLSESPALTGGLVLFSVWADHSRLLRFCPNSGSFALTVRRDVHTDTHGNIQFYRQKLTDQHVRTQVRDLRGGVVEVEREKKEKYGASDDRDFAGQHNIEDHTLPDSVFEEQLVLSLDEEEEDLITVSPEEPCSPPPSCGSPQFNSTHIAANRLTAMLNRKSQNDDRNMKLSVAGVTDDSSVTDSGLWRADEGGALLLGSTDTPPPCEDEAQGQKGISSFSPSVSLSLSSSPVSCSPTGLTLDRVLRYACFESANQSMTSPPSCDLSPTLVALEMDSEDDDDDEILIKKPLPQIPPDHNSNDNEQDVRNPAPDLTCIRSHSASSVTSDAPSKDSSDQGVRLRSYSYSSPKISLLPPRFSRDTRSPNSDLAADGAISSSSGSRSLLQALSLSKSLSLLNPVKQRAFSLTEQSQVKRELRFRRRAQSAEDESSIELADSLQHLTLSEFLKEIEEEEWDKYIIPSKNESEKYKVSRTFSFIKSRMYSTRNKSKGKGKEREGKDKQTTGHLFSAGNCVGPAMCVVCEKLATGKDLLHCSNCALVVHKGCKDSATQCLKKTQDKYSVSMVKNRTASLPQNFTVRDRSSSPLMVTSTSIPVMTSHERREAPSTCPLSRSVPTVTERFSESPEEDSDSSPWRNHIQSEELLQTTESSTSTDSSLMEDTVDAPLQNELAMDSLDLEAESWSLVVDPQFCRAQEKHIIKRQDIIYELMQTELHHVQTLTIMAEVFWRGMREEVQLEPETIGRIFPCLDELLLLHHNFLLALRDRRHSSALPDGDRNYIIHSIGDILLQQFSQENAERMKQVYGQFCSHHLEAVSFFKELQQQNKRFQIFIKQQSYNSLVKRREIPECILLVTQRITKYPVLLERLLQHTLEGTKEYDDVGRALVSIRELIAAVDLRVSEYDRSQRLQDILGRLENKSAAKLKGGHTFRKPDITAGRAVIHHGPLLWKTATGRLKDIMALLLTDTLVFLQEKDQKFLFASVDQKPPVISLQKLIVREVANEERGMFLISASASGPEMYEVHSSSKDERNTWMRLIREAVESCPEEQDETTSESEEERRVAEAKVQKIRKLQELLCNQDEQICSNLEEKLQIFAELSSLRGDGERGAEAQLLLRPGPDDTPQATLLLAAALKETEKLKATLSGLSDGSSSPLLNSLEEDSVPSQRSPSADAHRDEEEEEREGEEGLESHTLSSLHSAIDMDNHNINVQVAQSVQSLTQLLYSLQATVTMQDSLYEVQKHLLHSHSYPAHPRGPALQEQERQREAELRRAELAGVARLRERLAQERHCWERKCQARQQQQNELERGLEARERECHLEARKLQRGRQELEEQQQDYQQSLERLREGQRSVEREREQLELQRSLLQNWRHHRQSSLPAMLIPLDEVQNFCQDQTSAPDEDGSSLFLNEAVLHTPSLNNRHLHRYNHQHHPRQTLHQCSPDSPSSQNSLNSLLAQANHRHTSDIDLNNAWPAVHTPSFPGLSTAIANTDMGTQGQVQVVWSQEPMGAGNHAHHLTGNAHLDSQAFVAMETEGEEDGAEENIVYL